MRIFFIFLTSCLCLNTFGQNSSCLLSSFQVWKKRTSPLQERLPPSQFRLFERIRTTLNLDETHLNRLAEKLEEMSKAGEQLSKEEGNKLFGLLKVMRKEKWTPIIERLEELKGLVRGHQVVAAMTSPHRDEVIDTYHLLLDYAYVRGLNGEFLSALGNALATLPEALRMEDGRNYILFLLTLRKGQRLPGIRGLREYVTDDTTNKIVKKYFKMEGKFLRREEQLFQKFYDEIITQETERGRLRQGVMLHWDDQWYDIHAKAKTKARHMVDEYRVKYLKCHAKVHAGTTKKTSPHFINNMTITRPLSSLVGMGGSNIGYRPFVEWFSQGLLESAYKSAVTNYTSKKWTNIEESTFRRIWKKWLTERWAHIGLGFVIGGFLGTLDSMEANDHFTEIMGDQEARDEFVSILKEKAQSLKMADKILTEIERRPERFTDGEPEREASEDDSLAMEDINWENLTEEDLEREDVRNFVRAAVVAQVYEENSGILKTGSRGLDYFLFNALFGIMMSYPEFFLDTINYTKLCFDSSKQSHLSVSRSYFIRKMLIDFFIYFPLRVKLLFGRDEYPMLNWISS